MTATIRRREPMRIAALLVTAGALSSGPAAMLLVSWIAPQPEWRDVATFASHYHPVQVLPYLLGMVLLTGFVLFAAACHAAAPRELRVHTSAALVFTAIYGALVFTNYTIQLGVILRALPEQRAYIEHLTMANPASIAWFLEMFGYAAMGVATYLVAPLFRGSGRAAVIRALLVANGVTSVVGAANTAAFDRWVFSTWGIVSFAAWNVLVPVCFGLMALSPGAFPPAAGVTATPDRRCSDWRHSAAFWFVPSASMRCASGYGDGSRIASSMRATRGCA